MSQTVQTYTATIYVGLYDRDFKVSYDIASARAWLQDYCNNNKLCVTLAPTEFIYVNGREDGLIVGLINYPRFPATQEEIRRHALTIAQGLKDLLHQYKVSIVFPDETVMLSTEPGD